MAELAEVLRDALQGKAGQDALTAMFTAMREYVAAHPGRYNATVGDLDRVAAWSSHARAEALRAAERMTCSVSGTSGVISSTSPGRFAGRRQVAAT